MIAIFSIDNYIDYEAIMRKCYIHILLTKPIQTKRWKMQNAVRL